MREASIDLRFASEFSHAAEVLCFAQDDWDVQAGEEAQTTSFIGVLISTTLAAMTEWKKPPERQLLCQSPRDRQGLNLLSFSSLHMLPLLCLGAGHAGLSLWLQHLPTRPHFCLWLLLGGEYRRLQIHCLLKR